MAPPNYGLLSDQTRGDWVRLRTLVLLRWTAVVGQLAAVIVASGYYGMRLPLGPCLITVAALVITNLVISFVFPANKRLSGNQALMTLLFDLAQLSFLIFLTGGLTNPFALLVLAPVTISASALKLRTTVILASFAIGLVTLNAFYNVPLRYADGSVFAVPSLFALGFWLSIVIGVLFIGLYSRRVATEIRSMSDALLATQMALAREQKLTDLGGVVAAAAHELGTPLATIKLVSVELMQELSDNPNLFADAKLIREQADRCRDILRSMGRAGKDDKQTKHAPLSTVLREAAEPHLNRGKKVIFNLRPGNAGDEREPTILRSPEVIHGLRNLIQNAVDFAQKTVWVDGEWSQGSIIVRIVDDGNGYAPQVFGRIGDPFIRRRTPEQALDGRPEYEGMGLGLFIAKTLLERSGAELSFANASSPFLSPEERPERCGAIVELIWKENRLLAPADQPLGNNSPIFG